MKKKGLAIANNADGGGFVSLPGLLLSAKGIRKEDIPSWGGR